MLEDEAGPLMPTLRWDVFTLTSPAWRRSWLRDLWRLSEISLFFFCAPPPAAATAATAAAAAFQPLCSSKKGDFYPPPTSDARLFSRLHANYITRLKQSHCNEQH